MGLITQVSKGSKGLKKDSDGVTKIGKALAVCPEGYANAKILNIRNLSHSFAFT